MEYTIDENTLEIRVYDENDELKLVQKFNPNADSNGQFASIEEAEAFLAIAYPETVLTKRI